MPFPNTFGSASARGFGWTAGAKPVIGQVAYTTAGTYTWVAPAGVTSVSVVAVGPGGQVTCDGNITSNTCATFASYFINTSTVAGYPGRNNTSSYCACTGGRYVGTGGGNGGASGSYSYVGGSGTAGGGVGLLGQGANGAGGAPSPYGGTAGSAGSGGGGGGGGGPNGSGTAGGGAGGYTGNGGRGGNGGSNSCYWFNNGSPGSPGSGGCGSSYGGSNGGFVNGRGGGGLGWKNSIAVTPGTGYTVKVSGNGAVRIIWPGTTRLFPTTCTGNL